MTMATTDAPKMMDRSRRYIKDGKRRMMTDSGYMLAPASLSRLMFGKTRGGKYSEKQ